MSGFGIAVVTSAKLRQEIFALGGRHRGDPLGGALLELQDERLTGERRSLLRAVVAHLSQDGGAEAARPSGGLPPVSLANIVYVLVIVAAVIWTVAVVTP